MTLLTHLRDLWQRVTGRPAEPEDDSESGIVMMIRKPPAQNRVRLVHPISAQGKVTKDICPFCDTPEAFLEGPAGGICVNVQCRSCKAELNIAPVLANRVVDVLCLPATGDAVKHSRIAAELRSHG